MELKEIGAMRKCENLLLYEKKRKFSTIRSILQFENIIIRMKSRKNATDSNLISRAFSEIGDAQISEKITSLVATMLPKNGKKKHQKLVVLEPQMSM